MDEILKNTEQEEHVTYIDRKMLAEFMRRLSGKTEDGTSKSILSYQTYALEDDENSRDRTQIYTANKASIELSTDYNIPGYFTLDIIYHNYAEPELKMLWNRLQNFKRNLSMKAEKTWVFYFNILERASVTSQTEYRDNLLMCHVLNPIFFYLTREVPNLLVTENNINEELQGGNIIRMLIPENAVRFEITDEIDTSELKGEVEREIEEERYLNSLEEFSNNEWDE